MSSELKFRGLRPALALLAAALLTGAQDCDDNLGKGSPGPVSFRVSIAPGQVAANSDSDTPSLSADGRYVCFASRASNLASPTSSFKEIFVRDRVLDRVVNVSRLANLTFPTQATDCNRPSMSPNGQYVVFEARSELLWDPDDPMGEAFPGRVNLFFVDLFTDPVFIQRLPVEMDGDLTHASVSDNGWIAFQTDAPDVDGYLNPGGDLQVYVNFAATSTYILLSHQLGASSTPGDRDSSYPRISADGSTVVFESFATNLTAEPNPGIPGESTPVRRIYRADFAGNTVELVSRASGLAGAPADNHCTRASVSADGRYVAYLYQGGAMTVPDTTGTLTVVRRDRDPGSLATDLVEINPLILSIFIPYGEGDSTGISADGRYVAFTGMNGTLATATDLMVKVRDMQGGTVNASKFILGPGSTLSQFPGTALSQDGRWVAWRGDSALEVVGDTNAVPDVFGFGPIP